MIDRYGATNRLRRLCGMRGYGVYCRLVELCAAAPGRKIRYDLDDLVYDMREDADFIKRIVEEFELFKLDGEYLEDAFARTPEVLEAERQAQIKANRSAGARKAAETRRRKREEAKAQESAVPTEPSAPTPSVDETELFAPEPTSEPTPTEAVESFPVAPTEEGRRFETLRDKWNETFKGSRRMVTEIYPAPITWQNFLESSRFFTDRDYEEAFEQAKSEEFPWQFKDVLKTSNIQRLLTARENAERRRALEEPEMDAATKEIVEFARENGWNWDEVD